jgi:hypothetical protein
MAWIPIILYLDEQTGQTHVIPHKLFFPSGAGGDFISFDLTIFFFFFGNSMKLELEEKRLKEGERSAESINHGLLFHSLFPIVPCSFSYSLRIDFFRVSFKGLQWLKH